MNNNKTYDISDLLIYIWKNRRFILITTIIGVVISVVVSLLMPNIYKAETYLFPTSFLASSTMSSTVNQDTDPLRIGNEDDLEKTIQVLRSDVLTDKIVDKYKLISHYEIKDNNPHKRTLVRNEFSSNVSYNKTTYQGIIISVKDEDPKMAANIANDISAFLDSLVAGMQLQRASESYNIALKTYEAENNYLKLLEDSLDIYRQMGIIDFHKDADRYTEAYTKSLGKNTLTPKAKSEFDQKFAMLKKYGNICTSLIRKIDYTSDNASRYHMKLVQLKQNLDQPLSRKFTISPAQAPDKKFSPKRSIIVAFTTIGTFIFSIILLMFLDFFREMKPKFDQE